MLKYTDVEVDGKMFRLQPIGAMDGAWILKLLLDTDIAQQLYARGESEDKGRPVTRQEFSELQRLILAQCFELDDVDGKGSVESPVITFKGQLVGVVASDSSTVYSLVQKAIRVLIWDPFIAAKQAQLQAAG